MARNEAGLTKALQGIKELQTELWENVLVPGSAHEYNLSLQKAGRLADFLEFAQVMLTDALCRKESCGGHFREESRTEEGEALRIDDEYCYSAAWEYKGVGKEPQLHKEPLLFENVALTQRSYK